MSEQTLKFGDIMVNKKEFHASKQAIALNVVNTNKIVTSNKVKYSEDGFKYFIGYLHDDDVIRPLCIILPQSILIMVEKICLLKLKMNTLKSGIKLKSH